VLDADQAAGRSRRRQIETDQNAVSARITNQRGCGPSSQRLRWFAITKAMGFADRPFRILIGQRHFVEQKFCPAFELAAAARTDASTQIHPLLWTARRGLEQ